MALFKPLKGNRASLDSQPLHEGYAYFCVDDGSFHIDVTDSDGNLQRKQLNAKDAETLCGMSLTELQSEWSQNDVIKISTQLTAAEILALNDGMYYFTDSAYFYIYLYDSWNSDETAYVTNIVVKGLCKITDVYVYSYDTGFYYYKAGTRTYNDVEYICCPTESVYHMYSEYAGMLQLPIREVVHVVLRQYSDGTIQYDNDNNCIEYLRSFGWNIHNVLTQCTIHTNNTSQVLELYEVEKLVLDDDYPYLYAIKYVGYKDNYRYDVLCEIDNITVTQTEMATTDIATTTANGLMSSTDKAKVDTLPETIADTTYTTARYRASSLHSTETTPTTNGVIAWMYE